MTDAAGREAFIQFCEAAEQTDPVQLPINTPIRVGASVLRVVYDSATDTLGLITDAEWRRRLAKARAHQITATASRGYAAALAASPVGLRGDSWMGA